MISYMRIDPPPKTRWRNIIITFVFWTVIAILAFLYWAKFIFVVKMLFLTLIVCSIPSVTSGIADKWGEFTEAISQSFLATIIVGIFSLLFLGFSSLGVWILILFVLLLFALIGGYLVRLIQAKVINRLSNNKQFTFSSNEIDRLKDSAKHQILLYVSIPFGLIASTAYGFITGLPDREILILVPKLIIGMADIILLITLIVSAVIMSKPLMLFEPDVNRLSYDKPSEKKSLLDYAIKFLKKAQSDNSAELDYSEIHTMAYLVADLRKVYFYDAVHSIILLRECFLSSRVSLENDQIHANLPDRPQVYRMATD